MVSQAPTIAKDLFVDILRDKTLLQPEDLLIFQTYYGLAKHEASANDIARILGWSNHGAVVGKIVGFGMRILKKHPIEQRQRQNGKGVYWDFFFTGFQRGQHFIYRLKPELIGALEECGLVGSALPDVQTTYLFVWNPKEWPWTELAQDIEELQLTGRKAIRWKCRSHRSAKPGDRAFFAIAGVKPSGIFASGRIVSYSFLGEDYKAGNSDETINCVWIELDVLLNPNAENVLAFDEMTTPFSEKSQWALRGSGSPIAKEILNELEAEWFEFLQTRISIIERELPKMQQHHPVFLEGNTSQVVQTRYERNVHARNACLNHYGVACVVCGFNFEKFYGAIGYKFIHVHHLAQISDAGGQYVVDPINDLRPVCPNCHAMLHKEVPPISIDELREIIRQEHLDVS